MQLRSVNSNDSSNRSKLNEVQDIIKKIKREQQEKSNDLKNLTDAAMEKGQRLETELSLEEIHDEIAKIKSKLKHGKPVSLDPQSMRELIMTKKEALEANQGNYDNIKSSIYSVRKLNV